MSYKTEMHQNVAVWARRFQVEITNLDNAVAMANKIYGGVISRKCAIIVVAMKPVATILDRDLKDPIVALVANIVTGIVYDFCYTSGSGNANLIFRKELKLLLDENRLTEDEFIEIATKEERFVALALDAVAQRNDAHSRPSMVNAILAKVR